MPVADQPTTAPDKTAVPDEDQTTTAPETTPSPAAQRRQQYEDLQHSINRQEPTIVKALAAGTDQDLKAERNQAKALLQDIEKTKQLAWDDKQRKPLEADQNKLRFSLKHHLIAGKAPGVIQAFENSTDGKRDHRSAKALARDISHIHGLAWTDEQRKTLDSWNASLRYHAGRTEIAQQLPTVLDSLQGTADTKQGTAPAAQQATDLLREIHVAKVYAQTEEQLSCINSYEKQIIEAAKARKQALERTVSSRLQGGGLIAEARAAVTRSSELPNHLAELKSLQDVIDQLKGVKVEPQELGTSVDNGIAKVIADPDLGEKYAACNVGTYYVLEELGCNVVDFKKRGTGRKGIIRANDMYNLLAASADWKEVVLDRDNKDNWNQQVRDIQAEVNQGAIYVASYYNPVPNKSGHIAVLNRGEAKESGKWGGLVPIAMDTGEGQRWAAKKLSSGFGKEKKAGTKFYRYQGPIKKKQTL